MNSWVGAVLFFLGVWEVATMRIRRKADHSVRSQASTLPVMLGRVAAPLVRRGAAAIGRQSARNYGSGPLPIGYWRPQGPGYRPRMGKVYHTEIVKIPGPVKDLVPIKPNALIPFRPQPKALVPFRKPISLPRFHLATRPTVVPPAMRFNHLRVLGAVGASSVGAAAWSHGFWGRDYSLLPVEKEDGKAGWVASIIDEETKEPTSRYLTPSETEALGLDEDEVSSGDKQEKGDQEMQAVVDMEPCNIFSWSTWLNCLLPTLDEDVPVEEETIIENAVEICRDIFPECDASSCDNGQSPFCARTCGLYPCPPVDRNQSLDEIRVEEELSNLSDVRRGCTIMSCMSLAGRMACMKTCTTFFTTPAQTPANEVVADLDTASDSYPACTVLNCMTLVGRLMCQKTCQFQPSQEVPKVKKPSPTKKKPEIPDIEDLALAFKEPALKKPPARRRIKIEYEIDDVNDTAGEQIKQVMDHVMEDELKAQEQHTPTLPDVVLDDAANSEEVLEILGKAAAKPEVLWQGKELHDSLCALLTVGAFDCIAKDNKCRCFYLRLPRPDTADCSHVYPNTKTALTVMKNRRLALFPYEGCKCHGEQKTSYQGNDFNSCDLSVFSNALVD